VLSTDDAIISDELNHASIIDGIRLCKAKRLRYKHLDLADLEKNLQEAEGSRLKVIVTDGVFSMDGDIAPLPEIVALAKKYGAFTFVDECHASGVLGKTGRGTPEYFGVEGQIDVINSTLGKALGGGTGGYSAASKEVVDILRQRGRPYLFSNSIAPPVVGASLEVFDMIDEPVGAKLVAQLHNNTAHFRTEMKEAGFTILGHQDCPIAPVWLGDARLASEFANEMMSQNIYVIGFSYPVVPHGKARIRVQLSAAHTSEHIDRAVRGFVNIGKKKGVIPL
jgi:7-keto-8-aminopelargonate synthetase-like enzyme